MTDPAIKTQSAASWDRSGDKARVFVAHPVSGSRSPTRAVLYGPCLEYGEGRSRIRSPDELDLSLTQRPDR
ncbi:MAG: hypothetical protein R3B74_00455 [Nitrospirales bacterium]|nr:hypothetical protein [Nitrospirales bacterium]